MSIFINFEEEIEAEAWPKRTRSAEEET